MKAEAKAQPTKNSYPPNCNAMCINARVIFCRKFRVQRRSQLILPGNFTGDGILVGQGDILNI